MSPPIKTRGHESSKPELCSCSTLTSAAPTRLTVDASSGAVPARPRIPSVPNSLLMVLRGGGALSRDSRARRSDLECCACGLRHRDRRRLDPRRRHRRRSIRTSLPANNADQVVVNAPWVVGFSRTRPVRGICSGSPNFIPSTLGRACRSASRRPGAGVGHHRVRRRLVRRRDRGTSMARPAPSIRRLAWNS